MSLGRSLDLGQQRKRAKDLRRAHGAGSLDAAARIARHLPRARDLPPKRILAARFTLSEAQLVVAREAGFASWPRLRHALEAADAASLGEAIVDAALAGRDAEVRAMLAREPEIARRVPEVAAVVGDADAAEGLLDAEPGLAQRRLGARDWTPLLYLCCSRYRRDEPAARLAIARRLIDLGAELGAVGHEPGLASDHTTMLDEYTWRPIEGAAGRVASPALVRLLLAAGATLEHTTGALQQAVLGGNLDVLTLLLAAAPPWWQVIWALKACATLDRVAAARLLIAHASLPKTREPALREAIVRGRGGELVEILLGSTEPRELVEPIWRAAYRLAVRHGHSAACELLRARGLDDRDLGAVDRLIGACITGEPIAAAGETGVAVASEARSPVALAGYDPSLLRADDHQMLAWAVQAGRAGAVPRLVAAGLDPSAPDGDGDAPLHHAVRTKSVAALDALIAAGAAIDARNFDGQTPLELALARGDRQLAQRLLAAGADPARMSQLVDGEGDEALRGAGAVEREDPAQLFERAADAVAFGDLAALRDLLDDEPDLVTARSPRPHRATLLHYSAANGTEDPRQRTPPNAPAIAQLLVDRGADVEASCRLYGGGATPMALLLTSAIPKAAGLDAELVAVLARGGARLAAVDGRGPLVDAIWNSSPRAVQALVDAGAPIDSLFTAAGTDRLDVVEALLAGGADVNGRFPGNRTALHAAAAMGHVRAAQLLLDRGADPTLRDADWGNTPAATARYFGHAELAALLEPPTP